MSSQVFKQLCSLLQLGWIGMKNLIRKFALPVVCFVVEAALDCCYSQLHWEGSGIVLQFEQNLAVLISLKALGLVAAACSTHFAFCRLARRLAPLRSALIVFMLCTTLTCSERQNVKRGVATRTKRRKKSVRKSQKPTL